MHARKSTDDERADPGSTDDETAAGEGDPPTETQGARVDRVSDERLIQLFSRPQPPKKLLAGLRVLGFTADSVQFMTGARSRDVVYSWAAGRARPGLEQAKRLDEIRRVLHFICAHDELGAESAWMLFNAKFADMAADGPTAMELIGQGHTATVIGHLEGLIDDDGGGGSDPPPDQGQPPPPTGEPGKQPVESSG